MLAAPTWLVAGAVWLLGGWLLFAFLVVRFKLERWWRRRKVARRRPQGRMIDLAPATSQLRRRRAVVPPAVERRRNGNGRPRGGSRPSDRSSGSGSPTSWRE